MLTVGLCSSMSYLEQGFLRHTLCFQLFFWDASDSGRRAACG